MKNRRPTFLRRLTSLFLTAGAEVALRRPPLLLSFLHLLTLHTLLAGRSLESRQALPQHVARESLHGLI